MTSTNQTTAPIEFDPGDPELPSHLHEVLDEMRTRCPVAHSPHMGGFWALTRYEDVSRAARDASNFTATQGIMIPPMGWTVRVLPGESDPPEHTGYRKLLLPFFNERSMNQFEPLIRDAVTTRVAHIAELERCDLMQELAEPVPPIALAGILGLPQSDWPTLRRIMTEVNRTRFSDLAGNQEAVAAFQEYLNTQIELRRETPRDDLISAILHGVIDGEPIAPADSYSIIHMLIGAGHDTTVRGIGTLMYHLATVDGLWDALQSDRSLIPAAIDESLRHESSVMYLARTTTREVEMSGTVIPAGEKVMLLWGSANRDKEMFDQPDEFICPRPKNRHIAFGSGAHRCIGEPLARLELTVVLEEVLDRLARFVPADDDPPVWAAKSNGRGLKRLVVELERD